MTVPTIFRLKIDRFRGLKRVDWRPSAGPNLILGGGDVGKTTILDAVALLLSPVNPANLPDAKRAVMRLIECTFDLSPIVRKRGVCPKPQRQVAERAHIVGYLAERPPPIDRDVDGGEFVFVSKPVRLGAGAVCPAICNGRAGRS